MGPPAASGKAVLRAAGQALPEEPLPEEPLPEEPLFAAVVYPGLPEKPLPEEPLFAAVGYAGLPEEPLPEEPLFAAVGYSGQPRTEEPLHLAVRQVAVPSAGSLEQPWAEEAPRPGYLWPLQAGF